MINATSLLTPIDRIGVPNNNDPVVIIDVCGHPLKQSEMDTIVYESVAENVARFFEGKAYTFSTFTFPFQTILSHTFTRGNILTDTRYAGAQKKGLQGLDWKERAQEFASNPLAKAYKKIIDDKDWNAFVEKYFELWNAIRQMEPRIKEQETLEERKKAFAEVEKRKRELRALGKKRARKMEAWSAMTVYDQRAPLYPDQKWGVFKTLSWTIRTVYHTAVAVIFEYSLWILYDLDLMHQVTYKNWRKENVTGRLAQVIVEYQQMGYH